MSENYEETVRVTKNTASAEVLPLFSITQKLILDQDDEICGVSVIDWDQTPWKRRTFIHEHVIKLPTAKIYVFSDSVLCFGGKVAECCGTTRPIHSYIQTTSQDHRDTATSQDEATPARVGALEW